MVKWLTGAKMVDQTTQYVKSVVLRLVQKTMVDWQWLTRCPLPTHFLTLSSSIKNIIFLSGMIVAKLEFKRLEFERVRMA